MERSFIDPYAAVVDQPLLILPPRRWIFRRLGRALVLLFTAAFFSFGVFMYISVPVYMIAFWFLHELSAVWRAHRYSPFVLYTLALINLLIFIAAGKALRAGFYVLFNWLF